MQQIKIPLIFLSIRPTSEICSKSLTAWEVPASDVWAPSEEMEDPENSERLKIEWIDIKKN